MNDIERDAFDTTKANGERAIAERDAARAKLGRLQALVAECYQCRTDNGGYIPSELGDRLGAAVRDV